MKIRLSILFLVGSISVISAQSNFENLKALPVIKGTYLEGIENDWLIKKPSEKASLFRNEENNEIILSNGIISRTFRISPNVATTSFKILSDQEELIRAVTPEATVQINNFNVEVGGLKGQANLAFLYTDWIDSLKASPFAYTLKNFSIGKPEKRFDWKQIMPASNTNWPPKGVRLQMDYAMNDIPVDALLQLSSNSETGRERLVYDDYTSLNRERNIKTSKSHPRSSFNNEGKPGEIYTPKNTAVYVEYKLPEDVGIVETTIDPGTDESSSWGAGLALIWEDQIIKFNMRTGTEEGDNKSPFKFVVYDGKNENTRAGSKQNITFDKPWKLRFRIKGNEVYCEAAPVGQKWKTLHTVSLKNSSSPIAARVGKLGKHANGKDHNVIGKIVRLKVQEFAVYSTIKEEKVEELQKQINILNDITISVNYELYDGVPVLSKWVTIQNNSSEEIIVNNIVSEYLKLVDYMPSGGYKGHPELRKKPNVYLETDYAFGNMNGEVASIWSVHWGTDQDYITQISWHLDILNTVQIYPEHKYHVLVKPKEKMESIRGFVLPIDSREEERRSLHIRKMKRTIAPWITENPMMFHLTSSKPEEVKNALHQCNEIGYEMLNFSFGSRLNMENNKADNLSKFKEFSVYADSLGIKLGGYSLFSSRRVSEKDDVINPKTGKRGGFASFGNAPCSGSEWGLEYFGKLIQFFNETGFKTFTQDGPYPGDVCASTSHPGHNGLADSQYKQWKIATDFYKWCKSEGIHLRLPDHYFLTGGNQTAIGYRENNWSLPRREQLVHTRQNIFDGTWEKTPGMSWSFVPLQQYHGGGSDATIEPLKEHLSHYEMMLVSNLGMGLQSALRGKRLYDSDETKTMVKRVVDWYKKYRNILESDIIHLRRADGRDIDYMMHVNPELKEKGFLLVFNPTDNIIKKKIKVPLYYTGITEIADIREQENQSTSYQLNREYEIEIEVEVKPNWYNWYVIE